MLDGQAQMLVPKAAVKELEALGKDFEAAAKYAQRLKVLSSGVASGSVADAILGLVADGNAQTFCVLTEDKELQKQVSRIAGVPLFRFAREKLIVVAPAERLATEAQTAMDRVGTPA